MVQYANYEQFSEQSVTILTSSNSYTYNGLPNSKAIYSIKEPSIYQNKERSKN
jgi:hypothetical protein